MNNDQKKRMEEALAEMNQVIAEMEPVERKLIDRQMEVATKISTMMEERGWNITTLADQTGIARPHLSRVLAGVGNITLKTLVKIEIALNKDILKIELNIPDLEWTPEAAAFWGKTITLPNSAIKNETSSFFSIDNGGWRTKTIDSSEEISSPTDEFRGECTMSLVSKAA